MVLRSGGDEQLRNAEPSCGMCYHLEGVGKADAGRQCFERTPASQNHVTEPRWDAEDVRWGRQAATWSVKRVYG